MINPLNSPSIQGRGVALHETLHALGVAHEHVRMDRDQHIKVSEEKEKKGMVMRLTVSEIE